MYKSAPEHHKRPEKSSEKRTLEAKAIRSEQFKMAALKKMSSFAVLAALTSPIIYYAVDVHTNQELQANSIITIEDTGNALDPIHNDHALVGIDGFGSINGNTLAKYFIPTIQPIEDGQILAVGYNDAPLEPADIADKLIEKADDNGITSMSLIGESGGGPITMEVQELIRERSNIAVTAIYLLFAPNGIGGLQTEHQDQMNFVEAIKGVPGITYSTQLRAVAEMAFRSADYSGGDGWQNIGNFFKTADHVSQSIKEKKLPGTWLMVDQALQIAHADIKTRFENIKKSPNYEQRPTVVYVRTDNDPVVNGKKSSEEIGSYANDAHVPFFDFNIPGVVHGQPQFNTEAYARTFVAAKAQIQQSIQAQQEHASLHRVTGPTYTYNPTEKPKN